MFFVYSSLFVSLDIEKIDYKLLDKCVLIWSLQACNKQLLFQIFTIKTIVNKYIHVHISNSEFVHNIQNILQEQYKIILVKIIDNLFCTSYIIKLMNYVCSQITYIYIQYDSRSQMNMFMILINSCMHVKLRYGSQPFKHIQCDKYMILNYHVQLVIHSAVYIQGRL